MESSLLLLTSLLLITLSTQSTASQRCPDCGPTPVPYPLSTGPDCGDQSYKIRCDPSSKTLFFDALNASSYPISSIDPQIQRLVIRPANFTPNTCTTTDLRSQGIQLNQSLPFNITSSNTIVYLNCSESLLRSPLDCSSTSLCHSYVNGSAEAGACQGRGLICCTFRAGGSTTSYRIRVRESGCRAYRSFVNLGPEVQGRGWPDPGLELEWVLPGEPVRESERDCEGDRNSGCGYDPGGRVRRCFCNSGFRWDPVNVICSNIKTCQGHSGCDGSTRRTALISGLTSGLVGAVLVVIVGGLVYKRQRKMREARERLRREREEILNSNSNGRSPKVFTGKEIKRATNNFAKDRLLGSGGYGEVFMGILDDNTVVAVKCAKLGNRKGTDQVLNEVRILCQVNHRSVVRLLGCCVELVQPLMVYEYISNGTLFDHLHNLRSGELQTSLTWRRRLAIAHQTAEGLAYLHSSAVPPIYHRDVKSSNILLDEKLNAKVSDFGLSRLVETDLSHVSTCAQGTLGYLDPEYYRNYQLTDKSDVYSFGVVLLELLTSEKAIEFRRGQDDVNLVVFVQRKVDEEALMETIDPMLMEGTSKLELETMKALAFLALGCLEERRQNRPSMKEVAEEIEYIMSIEIAGEPEKA